MVELRKAFKAVAFLIKEQIISKHFITIMLVSLIKRKAFFPEIRDKTFSPCFMITVNLTGAVQ
ncbi:hypothetical protein COP00_19190 [Bacillus glycinifermentans]|uniref:Uncharacterized protein n=1 Tax=Bacillus glycinifermentans TaxID=1664069 RepID=A0A0T6BSL1_9BACI|nr:hypothetical protein COP00_19190 [Bacillus glycinifermentans]KRT94563.1 hypothetical protein AB447_214385 [Bacillus glycinifermentans]